MPRKSSRALWTARLSGGGPAKSDTGNSTGDLIEGGCRFRAGSILGIDPSLRGSGFAVVSLGPNRLPQLVHSETLKVPARSDLADCLARISRAVTRICCEFQVDHVALEQTIYVQNFQTAQILGAARGAAIAAAALAGKPVYEYPPLRIKQAVIGVGRASKTQMARTVGQMLRLKAELAPDEADAVGVALCHAFTWRMPA